MVFSLLIKTKALKCSCQRRVKALLHSKQDVGLGKGGVKCCVNKKKKILFASNVLKKTTVTRKHEDCLHFATKFKRRKNVCYFKKIT